ncbi:hypothetical protein [Novosphingobium sp.]|jgi:hypothetical protein|uniref:hypothetical protein n=1 Tax=Novosphingobium sp. TaxID=1874826 RepID=UPI0028A9AFB2|nr:hypothetical protein [Novosphingobium sp.]
MSDKIGRLGSTAAPPNAETLADFDAEADLIRSGRFAFWFPRLQLKSRPAPPTERPFITSRCRPESRPSFTEMKVILNSQRWDIAVIPIPQSERQFLPRAAIRRQSRKRSICENAVNRLR